MLSQLQQGNFNFLASNASILFLCSQMAFDNAQHLANWSTTTTPSQSLSGIILHHDTHQWAFIPAPFHSFHSLRRVSPGVPASCKHTGGNKQPCLHTSTCTHTHMYTIHTHPRPTQFTALARAEGSQSFIQLGWVKVPSHHAAPQGPLEQHQPQLARLHLLVH